MVLRSSLSVRPWHEFIKTIDLVIYDAAAPMIHNRFVCRAAIRSFRNAKMEGGICPRSGSTKGPSRSAFMTSLIDCWNRTPGKTHCAGKNRGKYIFKKMNIYLITIP